MKPELAKYPSSAWISLRGIQLFVRREMGGQGHAAGPPFPTWIPLLWLCAPHPSSSHGGKAKGASTTACLRPSTQHNSTPRPAGELLLLPSLAACLSPPGTGQGVLRVPLRGHPRGAATRDRGWEPPPEHGLLLLSCPCLLPRPGGKKNTFTKRCRKHHKDQNLSFTQLLYNIPVS